MFALENAFSKWKIVNFLWLAPIGARENVCLAQEARAKKLLENAENRQFSSRGSAPRPADKSPFTRPAPTPDSG